MQSIVLLLLKYKYLILFPLATFEGPVVSIVVGFMVYTSVFSFLPAYLILLCGDLIPDNAFYCIGYFGHKSKFVERHVLRSDFFINHIDKVKNLWENHTFKTIFFGKLAYGMALPFLVSAGIVKLPYKKFITYAFPVTIFQYTVLMTIGYYMGSSYILAVKYVDYAYYILSGLVIVFIFFYVLVIKYAGKKIRLMEDSIGS